MNSPWLVRARARERPSLRLVCFSYAGAGASVFARWGDHLPGEVEVVAVQPPGRETRLREPAMPSLQEIADAAAREIDAMVSGPIALFGHSMGAVVAVEAARALAAGGREPVHLFVSGRRPPHVPDRDAPLRHLSDDDFVSALGRRYEPIPSAILEDKALFALLLPALRTDIAALETHPVRDGAPLGCDVTVYAGADDARAPRPDLEAWRSTTTGSFRVKTFPGGHFYLTAQRTALVADIASTLVPAHARVVPEIRA